VDNLVDALVERHRRQGRGAATALIDDRGAWSFDDLARAAAEAAGALRERGAGRGDRVAVLLPDGRAAAAAILGAVRLGAIAVPLDAGSAPAARRAVLDDCAPAVVVDAALPAGRPAAPARVGGADPACLIYTSGTTGPPKGVVHVHGLASGASFLRDVVGAGPGDRCHAAARTASALGFFIGLVRPLAAGAAAVLSAGPGSGRRALAVAERHGVTVLAAVPTTWLQVAAVLARRAGGRRLATVRAAIASGDRLPACAAERMAACGGPALIDALGTSECGDVVLCGAPGGAGFTVATPGIDVRVADRAGAPVPDGLPGLLWVRSPVASPGYWNGAGAAGRLGAWLRLEDAAVREGGAVRHLGRADELFKVDGRLVSPAEIERALAEDPRVAEAAVVGAPQGGGLTRPAAFVVPVAGTGAGPRLARELRRLVARRLAPALAPARVVVTDALPRLASGKLDRRRLASAA
jgi:acyl-coenzyme A synthetase/AMP-(fatty) acid ligase